MKDKNKFKNMIAAMADKFEKTPTPYFQDMVWETLKPFSDEQCITAFNHVFRYGKFWKDLIPDLLEVIEGPESSLEETATIQANLVAASMDYYSTVLFDDHVTNAVIKQGFNGWVTLCKEMTADQVKWFKKDFIKTYIAYARAGIKSTEPLIGWLDTENQRLGYQDKSKIKQIGITSDRKLLN